MNKLKRYLENHKETTIEDYNNQRHKMHVIQAQCALKRSSGFGLLRGKHVGSKKNKTLLAIIRSVCNQ